MDRGSLKQLIFDVYSVEPDYPWAKYPEYEVFRHGSNNKWFALIMEVPKSKLGLQEAGTIDVVNVKCNPAFREELLREKGFFLAYHMNKLKWITVALDGSVGEHEMRVLLEYSYHATEPKICRKK